jgi:hypothetical protein
MSIIALMDEDREKKKERGKKCAFLFSILSAFFRVQQSNFYFVFFHVCFCLKLVFFFGLFGSGFFLTLLWEQFRRMSQSKSLMLGDVAPDFSADTTIGPIK